MDPAASAAGRIAALRRRQNRLVEELEILGEDEAPQGELDALRAAIRTRFLDLETRISALVDPRRTALERSPTRPPAGFGDTQRSPTSARPAGVQKGLYAACGLDARYDHLAQTLTVTAIIDGVSIMRTLPLGEACSTLHT